MPKITVCPKCGGKGKVKAATPAGAAQDATIFLRCRECNGIGWVITPEKGEEEYERGEAVDVYKELEEIESNPFTRDDVVSYLKLIIRLLENRLPPLDAEGKKKRGGKKAKATE
jgi:DnaJ-class molecular chaperone